MLTDFNGEAIAYDANGCPLTYRDTACTFTRGTLLATYGSNTFDYDADGIRTKKNGITFTYVDGKLIRQTGGSGTIDFIYGAGGAIGFKFNNTTYIYRRNLMGDVTHIYTTDGTLVVRYVYDAWGNHRIITNVDNIGTINPIRYRGYYYDTETDLYYLEARYYDPETGRFISQDSIDFIVPNHLTGLNLYAYCNNNPVMNVDPSGCLVFTTALLIAIGIGAGIGALTGAAVNGATYAMEHAGTDSFSWQGFGAAVAGGAVSGLITGAVAGAMSIFGGSAGFVFGVYTAMGFVGGVAGSVTEKSINGTLFNNGSVWDIFYEGAWGAAGGALGGLMEGAITPVRVIAQKTGKPLSKVLTKVIQKAINEIGPSLFGGAISDFTNWYTRFAIENTVNSYRRLA